jgi:hypothetical protein
MPALQPGPDSYSGRVPLKRGHERLFQVFHPCLCPFFLRSLVMSSISALAGSSQWSLASVTQVQGSRVSGSTSGDSSSTEGTEKPHGRHHGGGGGMVGDIAQVLQQMGVQLGGTQASSSSSTASDSLQGQDGPPPPPPEGNSAVGDAMHTLMHDLFQAVKDANGSSSSASSSSSSDTSSSDTSTSSTDTKGYDNFETGLQKVLQQLSTDSGSELSKKLGDDLQKLVSAFSASATGASSTSSTGSASTDTSSTPVTTSTDANSTSGSTSANASLNVQDFLSALQQRVAQHGERHGGGEPFGSQGQLFAASA